MSSSVTSHGALRTRVELGAADVVELGLSLPGGTSFETWKTIGRRLGRQHKLIPWKLGDWLFFGEGAYGSRYLEGMDLTGLEYGTLRNYASVSSRFVLSRRHDKLSFGHHAEVAYLGSDVEQDEWLDRAEREGLSVKQLRQAMKDAVLPEGAVGEGELAVSGSGLTTPSSEPEQAPSESAELHRLLESMRTLITLEDAKVAHEASDDPLGWFRARLDEVVKVSA